VIRDAEIRSRVHRCFLEANRRAAAAYEGQQRALYGDLKLAGILEAPVNLCVTCDRTRARGSMLGRQTDPMTDLYSTACAVQNLWLAARAESVGVGWVSILDFEAIRGVLGVPENIVIVAYLCAGYVSEFPEKPDLETRGWEQREHLEHLIHFERWGNQDPERASALVQSAPVK